MAEENNAVPLVSIITIVRNDRPGLSRTIASVARFKGNQSEYIVIDGASTDDTLQALDSETIRNVDTLVSEPDKGIYDAMNKGIERAHGTYLLFLNAGDELLVDLEALIKSHTESPVLLYGLANIVSENGTLIYIRGKRLLSLHRLFKGMPLCHQAILYRRDAMTPYDLRFKIISDRVATYTIVKKYGLSHTTFVNCIIANSYDGGVSGNYPYSLRLEEENLFYRCAGKSYYVVIKAINTLFRFKIKYPLLRLINNKSKSLPENKNS
jgi:glycosyltransferase involved in cell wall biosynthesis